MQKHLSWLFRLGTMLALLAPAAAWADAPANSVIIGNGQVALGVDYDGGLDEAGTGLQFTPTGAEGLAQVCVCGGWSLLVQMGGKEPGVDRRPGKIKHLDLTGTDDGHTVTSESGAE